MRYFSFIYICAFCVSFSSFPKVNAAEGSAVDQRPIGSEFEVCFPAEDTDSCDTSKSKPCGCPEILTLKDAIALTLIHNPQLKVFGWEVRAAEARRLQAGLGPNPELGVEVENVGGSGEMSSFESAETTIALSQLIEMGDKAGKREKVANLNTRIAEWDFETKRIEMYSGVSKAFVDVLRAQQRLELSNSLLKLSEEIVNLVRKQVEAGKVSPLEQARVQIEYSNAKLSAGQAKSELEIYTKKLAGFWNVSKPGFKKVKGDFEAFGEPPATTDVLACLVQNPAIERANCEIKMRQADVHLQNANSKADITLSAGFRRFSDDDSNAVVFGVAIPLQSSDRNQGGRLESKYNLQKAINAKEAVWISIQNDFNEVYGNLLIAYSKLEELQATTLPATEKLLSSSKIAYQNGKIDYLKLIDAQKVYFETQVSYLEILTEYHKAAIDLEQLTCKPISQIK